MINTQYLELPLPRTSFYGSKAVRAIEAFYCSYFAVNAIYSVWSIHTNKIYKGCKNDSFVELPTWQIHLSAPSFSKKKMKANENGSRGKYFKSLSIFKYDAYVFKFEFVLKYFYSQYKVKLWQKSYVTLVKLKVS